MTSVLIVCLSRAYGGADVRVLQTARWLRLNGHPYTVACLYDSQLHRTLRAEGHPNAGLGRGRGDPRLARDLARLAQGSTTIDLHNMQSQYWGAVAAASARAPNRVATVHSLYREAGWTGAKKRLHEGALHLCKRTGFRFIAVSASVETYLRDEIGVPDARITPSLNGIEPLGGVPSRCPVREEAGWPCDAVVLGMIGRLEPVKGHRVLMHALARLRAEGERRARLFVVGSGRDALELRRLAEDLDLAGVIHFAGFRRDIPEILAGIDLLCQPSQSEGLPYSILEACRAGVPVVSSDLPGIRAVLTDDETAFFVRPGDVADLSDCLWSLVEDTGRRARVGRAARHLVETDLSVDAMMKGTLAAYRGEVGQ